MERLRRSAYTLLALAALGVALHGIAKWYRTMPIDLRDFVAGGDVVLAGGDPYRTQPLFDDERRLAPASEPVTVVAPVPVPPYDLAALALLSRLPLRVAIALMAALTIGSGAVTYLAIVRFSPLAPPLAAAVVAVAVLGFAINVGQIAPIAIAALAAAAWALRRGRPRLAALGLLVSAIEPHMAAGPIVAAFLAVPRTRATLAGGVALMAVIDASPHAVAAWRGYAATLPLHAAAEAHSPWQYSLTWLLTALGVPVAAAVRAGGLTTVVLAAATIAVVLRAGRRAIASGAVVALPALAAVIGGAFVHAHQIAIAIVPALWYLRPAERRADAWIVAALIVPFPAALAWTNTWPGSSEWLALAIAFAVAWATVFDLQRTLGDAEATRRASVVVGVLGTCFLGFVAIHHRFALDYPRLHVRVDPLANASLAWRQFCDSNGAVFHETWYLVAVKAVTWLAASAALVMGSRALGASPAQPSRRESG